MKTRLFAVIVAMSVATQALAAPVSIPVKQGLLITPDDTQVEVDEPGRYLNNDALKVIFDTLEKKDAETNELRAVIAKLEPQTPWMPTWASILISAALSALTVIAGVFAVNEVAK